MAKVTGSNPVEPTAIPVRNLVFSASSDESLDGMESLHDENQRPVAGPENSGLEAIVPSIG